MIKNIDKIWNLYLARKKLKEISIKMGIYVAGFLTLSFVTIGLFLNLSTVVILSGALGFAFFGFTFFGI
jgi:hypothetical protein